MGFTGSLRIAQGAEARKWRRIDLSPTKTSSGAVETVGPTPYGFTDDGTQRGCPM